ncbi:MAG: hypothetical protein JKY54_08655 [Flavobacteriales bacterium]|nr:hypothetical protein [Flavobacteriales bacterium]
MSNSDDLLEYDPIADYAQQKLEGRDYSDIRKELTEKGHTAAEIKRIMFEIDDELLGLVNQPKAKKSFFSNIVVVAIGSIVVGGLGINSLITESIGLVPLLVSGLTILAVLLRISYKNRQNILNRNRYIKTRSRRKI